MEEELETNGNSLKWGCTWKIRDSKYSFEHTFNNHVQSIRQELETYTERARTLKRERSNRVNEKIDFYTEKRKIINRLKYSLKDN